MSLILLPTALIKGKGPSLVSLSKGHRDGQVWMETIQRHFLPEYWDPAEAYVLLHTPHIRFLPEGAS